MFEQINIFEGHVPFYKITKPVKLIELFAGIGSQHQALKNLGVKVEHSTIVEWQVNSIQAYNDIHVRKYDDHTQGLDKQELANRLSELGVSIDYNQPARLETLLRKGDEWLRNVYNNIINTNNKVNIMSVKASHLNIVDTDKYDYILTYSFPCQDLSKAGKGKGMSDKTTRSGLLWEVERILTECEKLPQVLLMENVPDVIGTRYINDFRKWDERLREWGYTNHIQVLNSKDYGIPQNRERAFMVSILGNYLYKFPNKQPLTLRLKDMLEKEVDEKYYLNDNVIERLQTNETKEFANYLTWEDDKERLNTQDHRAYFEDRLSGTIPAMERGVPNVLLNVEPSLVIPEDTKQGYALAHEGDGVYTNRPQQNRGVVQKQMIQTIKADSNDIGVVVSEKITLTPINENCGMLSGGKWDKLNESSRRVYNETYVSPTITTMAGGNLEPKVALNNLRIRKLTPRECYRLMGFSDEAYYRAEVNQSNSSLYHQAGDSIVVNVLMELFRSLL